MRHWGGRRAGILNSSILLMITIAELCWNYLLKLRVLKVVLSSDRADLLRSFEVVDVAGEGGVPEAWISARKAPPPHTLPRAPHAKVTLVTIACCSLSEKKILRMVVCVLTRKQRAWSTPSASSSRHPRTGGKPALKWWTIPSNIVYARRATARANTMTEQEVRWVRNLFLFLKEGSLFDQM